MLSLCRPSAQLISHGRRAFVSYVYSSSSSSSSSSPSSLLTRQSLPSPLLCGSSFSPSPSSPSSLRWFSGVRSKSSSSDPEFDLTTAVRLAKAVRAGSDYDETVKLVLHTALDPRKSNQQLRGIAQLPHGTGKEVRVAVFAEGAKAQEALDAGADVVGTDELVDMIKAGNIDFDRCIATPNMMPVIGTVARILGPKGLVPSPKLGTLTMNIKEAVEAAKQGEIVLRANEHGEIQAAVGKLSFPSASITENIAALMKRVLELKPDGHKKGVLVLDVDLTTCQGPRIRVKCNQAPFRG